MTFLFNSASNKSWVRPAFEKRMIAMFKYSLSFLLLAISLHSWADTAVCTIVIQEVNAGTKQTIEHTFIFKPGAHEGQRKHFTLTDRPYLCTLAFFNLNSGTMLSCQFDELGHNFVQSDRSVINEAHARNNLRFRYKSSFYVLESVCK